MGSYNSTLPSSRLIVQSTKTFPISGGHNRSFFLDTNGSVWFCGKKPGQLKITKSHKLENLPEIKEISSGENHILFLDFEGKVWVWGDNCKGQLGICDIKYCKEPIIIQNIPPILSISCGFAHSLLLDFEGFVWTFGNNFDGQLGLDNVHFQLVPAKIPDLPKIQRISCSGDRSFFLDVRGAVWFCGENLSFIRQDNIVKLKTHKPFKIERLPPIQYFTCGKRHALFLDIFGNIWACGANKFGELGLGDFRNRTSPEQLYGIPQIQFIASGSSHSFLLDIHGRVWGFGRNNFGQLGRDSREYPHLNKPTKISHIRCVQFVSCGNYHSLFLDNMGTVWSCGDNDCLQLGRSTLPADHRPARIFGIPQIKAC